MKQISDAELAQFRAKPLTDAEEKEVAANWPRCFVCGGWANGTNRTSDMWTCGPHWATSLDEALAIKAQSIY